MYRRMSRWLCLCLVLGCAAPEDKNPTMRCSLDSDCSGLQACYRGFCLGDADGVVSEDPWSSSGDGDAGSASEQPVVGGPKDAVAPPSVPADAGSAGASNPVADAGVAMPPPPPATVAPTPTTPASEPAGNGGTAAPPTPTPTPTADAGATPTNPPATPPASKPPASSPPEKMPPAAEPAPAGSLLGALIESGIAPASMLACVPACLVITQQRECERCIDRALTKERGENPCTEAEDAKGGDKEDGKDDDEEDDERANAPNDPLCAVWNCARGTCRGGS